MNIAKQYVFTNNDAHLERIANALPQHKVYIGGRDGHTISGIPIGGDDYIRFVLQDNLDKTKSVIDSIAQEALKHPRKTYSPIAVHSWAHTAPTCSCSDALVVKRLCKTA